MKVRTSDKVSRRALRSISWLLIICLVGGCLVTCTGSFRQQAGTVTFHFLDVGQGDASLITTPEGCILIDAGTNMSELTLRSYLDMYDVRELAYVILSHPHEDHIGGADMLLSHYRVGCVIMSDMYKAEDSTVADRLLEGIQASGCRVLTSYAGLTVTLGDVTVTLLGPVESIAPETQAGERGTETNGDVDDDSMHQSLGNDDSLIVKITYGSVSALYMGDAELAAEESLISAWPDGQMLDCDILKLGHHGSASSTAEALLDVVTPAYAVVSAGAGNAYGHPSMKILTRLSRRNIICLRTDIDGTVRLVTDGVRIWRDDE